MTLEQVRSYFPHLNTGNIYLNHAAVSPLSSFVIDKINNFLFGRSITDIDNFSKVGEIIEGTKERVAKLIKCDKDRLAFFDSTTTGLNLLAQGINWQQGDKVLLTETEFPSNIYPFLNLRSKGVEAYYVRNKNAIVTADDIINAVKPDTRLIYVNAVQFLSGYRADLKRIGKYCRENEIIFCVEASQAVGAVQLNVHESCIDFLTCGSEKWLMGLRGLSFMYLTQELQNKFPEKFEGWSSFEDALSLIDFDLGVKKSAESLQSGTISVIGATALSAALDLMETFGLREAENNIISNSRYFINALAERGFNSPLLYEYDKNIAGIVSFYSSRAKEIYNVLTGHNVSCSLREGFIRFSPHFYNSKSDIDKVIETIDKELLQ